MGGGSCPGTRSVVGEGGWEALALLGGAAGSSALRARAAARRTRGARREMMMRGRETNKLQSRGWLVRVVT